ncbi:hypothetical protein ACFY6U_50865 [Streptomyces sp. NPDC013157]|uniref:hypothetical protein n=1 Tax=Streptomyces sp. NPDC013157 TaxID=3364861 RepID=UPI00367394BD
MPQPHPTMRSRVRALLFVSSAVAAPALLVPTAAHADSDSTTVSPTGRRKTVASGETWEVTEITRLTELTVEDGAVLAAAGGHQLSLTVNGVETGSVIDGTYGTATVIAAGAYRGDVVVTPTVDHTETFSGSNFHIRQAVWAGADGVVRDNSVLSAVRGGKLTDAYAKDVALLSTGEDFNGFYVVEGASYTLIRPTVRFDGNGRTDFATAGSAITAKGAGTRLVVEDADIDNKGSMRSAVISHAGANVIVKNSRIRTRDGVLPDDYEFGLGPNLRSVPWMLGLSGNVRATTILGADASATYIGCDVSSERWGVLSTDSVTNAHLTAINTSATITGDSGYGTYSDGPTAHNLLLGTRVDAATMVAICGGGHVTFADSTREAVAGVDTDRDLRLTARELAAITPRGSVLHSRNFGVMFHTVGVMDPTAGGWADISGATRFTTGKTLFLNKSTSADITVDGSRGATLQAGNGVLYQLMETDDPAATGYVYTDPTTDPVKDDTFDTTAEHDTDATFTLTDIQVAGDIYNSKRDGRNLVATFTRTRIQGVISASKSMHLVDRITEENADDLGHVTNTAQAAVNNGVIVTLGAGSVWTVTGTSYLTKLTVAATATVQAARGKRLTLTVDGKETALTAGSTYTGAVQLTVS